jgi:hypothetical protein
MILSVYNSLLELVNKEFKDNGILWALSQNTVMKAVSQILFQVEFLMIQTMR